MTRKEGHDEEEGSAWHHIVIAGLTGNLRCPIGVGHDNEKVGHDGEEGSASYHIVIAGLTGNLLTGNLRCPIGVGHDEGKSEMPDRGRA